MRVRYWNAGTSGREYTRLEVTPLLLSKRIELILFAADSRTSRDIQLSPEQAARLAQQLTEFAAAASGNPLIEELV